MASALASPSYTMNDSNAFDSKITSAQKQELVLRTEADRGIILPSPQVDKAKMPPIKTTGAETQGLSASVKITADIASPSSTTSTSTMLSNQTTRVESQLVPVSSALEIGSPSLTIGRTNKVTCGSISLESQEHADSTQARRDINSPCSEDDGMNTVVGEMAYSQIEELEGSIEAIANMGHFNPDVDVSILEPHFIDNSSLTEQEQIVSTKSVDDVGSSRRVTEEQNETSEVLEAISLPSSDVMAVAEVLIANDLLSSDTNAPIMVPELIETSSAQDSELPFGPFSVEGTPDIESPSPAFETPATTNVSDSMEIIAPEDGDQTILGEFKADIKKNPELGRLILIESPKFNSSAGSELIKVSQDISLSSHTPSTNNGDDALESGLTDLLKSKNSSESSYELDTSHLDVCNEELKPEPVQASLKETAELTSTAANTPGNVSPWLASSEATVVPENLEMDCSDFPEHRKRAKIKPDIENSRISAGVFNVGPDFVDKKAAGTTEPTPSPENTLEMSPSSSSHAPPNVILTNPELSSAKAHEGSSSKTSSSLSSPPSWIADANEFSEAAETSTFETTHLTLAAGNHHSSNDDGTQLLSFEDGTAAYGSGNTIIESSEEDVEMNLKSTMPDMYSHLNTGWNFAELGQDDRGDMMISDKFEFGDPWEPSFDMHFPSRFDEAATNIPDFDFSAAATQETVRSVAERPTTLEHFEMSSLTAGNRSVPEGTLNSPPLSIDNVKEEFDTDNKIMDDMYALLASAATGVDMQQPMQYPTTRAYEPAVKSSPEIKMEPISMEDIPHMDSLPLATADQKRVQRLVEEWSHKIREGAPSPEATPLLETKPSTLKAEPREMSSTEMQLLPVSTSKGACSPCNSPEDRAKCSRKRLRVEVEDIEEDQKRPAKKLQQQLVDTPQPKLKKGLVNQTIELYVGPTNKCILVEKHILTKSPFFALLFNQHPSHKKFSRAYHFPRFDTYALATILHWLHYGNIQSIAEDYRADEIFHTTHMIKVHLLCSKLQLRSLMNLTVELLGHGYLKNKSAPTIEEIDITYSETDQTSGLRIYMAAWARCREHAPLQKFMMAGPWDQIRFKVLCKKHSDLLKDVKWWDECSDLESPINLNPRFHEICWYHDHPEGEQCGVSGKTFETACSGIEPRLHEPFC